MTNDELIKVLLILSREHFENIVKMVNEMNAHSTKKVVCLLREIQ